MLMDNELNVLGTALKPCNNPATGYFRDRLC